MARRASSVFRRFLEIVLDRETALKTQRDTQEALRKGTDPREPVKNLSKVEKGLTSLGKVARMVGGVLGGLLSARAILRATIDYEAAVADLDAALASTGHTVGLTRNELLGLSNELSSLSRFSGQQVQGGLARLLGYTDVQGESFERAARAAVDMATRLRIDVASAAEKVGNALNYPSVALNSLTRQGFRFTAQQTEMIKALEAAGDIAGAQAIILDELELAYQGAAEAGRDTLGGALAYLKNEFTDSIRLTDSSSRSLARWINVVADGIPKVRKALEGFRVGREIAYLEGVIAGGERGGFLGWFSRGFSEADVARARQRLAELRSGVEALSEAQEQIEARERADALAAERVAEAGRIAAAAAAETERRVRDEMVRAEDQRLRLLIQAVDLRVAEQDEVRELIGIYHAANRALRDGNRDLDDRVRLTQRAADAATALGIGPPTRDRPALSVTGGGVPLPGRATPLNIAPAKDEVGQFTKFVVDNFDTIESAGQMAALGMQHSFQSAFEALGEEGNALGNFFEALFRGTAAAALSSLAEIAAAKVMENAARAIEAGATALLTGNPAAAAAAAKFTAAAVAWAALGGAAGAASSGAGGARSSSFRGHDVTGRQVDRLDRGGPDVTIILDMVDDRKPGHQKVIGEASRRWNERTGGSLTVRTQ